MQLAYQQCYILRDLLCVALISKRVFAIINLLLPLCYSVRVCFYCIRSACASCVRRNKSSPATPSIMLRTSSKHAIHMQKSAGLTCSVNYELCSVVIWPRSPWPLPQRSRCSMLITTSGWIFHVAAEGLPGLCSGARAEYCSCKIWTCSSRRLHSVATLAAYPFKQTSCLMFYSELVLQIILLLLKMHANLKPW